MAILYHCAGDDGRMLAALRAALPEESIHRWTDTAADADEVGGDMPGDRVRRSAITDAVVWLPPANFFDGLVALERVHALAAGVDQLLTHPGLPSSATVIRLEDAGMGERMAEYVLYGVLHAHRRFPAMAAAAREHRWAREVRTRRARDIGVGILGAGVLGQCVARRLRANGYRVGCWSRKPRTLPDGVSGHVGEAGLDACLAAADVLVCLLPLTEVTRGILDASLFARLPEGAYLINPGRGEHLVERDLLATLDAGHLAGALLDVFAQEPLPATHPFWREPRITVTPHLAAPSPVRASVEQIAANFATIARGETPSGVVDRTLGY